MPFFKFYIKHDHMESKVIKDDVFMDLIKKKIKSRVHRCTCTKMSS